MKTNHVEHSNNFLRKMGAAKSKLLWLRRTQVTQLCYFSELLQHDLKSNSAWVGLDCHIADLEFTDWAKNQSWLNSVQTNLQKFFFNSLYDATSFKDRRWALRVERAILGEVGHHRKLAKEQEPSNPLVKNDKWFDAPRSLKSVLPCSICIVNPDWVWRILRLWR